MFVSVILIILDAVIGFAVNRLLRRFMRKRLKSPHIPVCTVILSVRMHNGVNDLSTYSAGIGRAGLKRTLRHQLS